MHLRKQTLVPVIAMLAGFVVFVLAGLYVVVRASLDELHRAQVQRAVKRVSGVLEYEQRQFDASVGKLLGRADKGALAGGEAIQAGEMVSWGWTGYIVTRNGRDIDVTMELRPDGTALQPMPVSLARAAMVHAAASQAAGATPVQSFWLRTDKELFQTAQVALGGEGSGAFLVLRRFDASSVERLTALAGIPIRTLDSIPEQQYPTDGILPLVDRSGKAVGALHLTICGFPSAAMIRIMVWASVLMTAAMVAAYLVTEQLLRRRLVRRLARVTAELGKIQGRANPRARLEVADDETAALVREINHLLAASEGIQASLERVNAEMQQRVAERTAALADANAALEADIAERIKAEQERERLRVQLMRSHKMEAVGTLAGGIAHDFNNILAGMLGHAHLIGSDVPPDHPVQAHLRQVLAAGERAAALVRQILAFSRQTPGEKQHISVGKIAREALSLLRAALPSGISIRCQVDAATDIVDADPTQLHQVFMNLGANAGHAMAGRGGEMAIIISNVTLAQDCDAGRAGEYVAIEVRDTGCGMTPEVMDRIFDPFFSTKPVNEGTGLGLAVVHGIVTDHGGTISVESQPGRGTSFRILMPLATSADSSTASRHAMPLGGSERILVVDDEEMVLSVISKSLERLGYHVVALQSSTEALRLFTANPGDFDLLITDQTMPEISGLKLAAAVRALRPNLPIILVTGYSPEVSGKDASALGVSAVVTKPIDIGEMTTLMRLELETRR